ncbi:MAG: hypothetical protein C0524_04505 [Rhodobacter sp.]|nr:hypothetical protein [Rhodobacter sp.]
MAFSIEVPGPPFSKRYTELDAMLAAKACDLLAALKSRGDALPGIDTEALGQVIFNSLNQLFVEFVKAEDSPPADLHRVSARHTASLAR